MDSLALALSRFVQALVAIDIASKASTCAEASMIIQRSSLFGILACSLILTSGGRAADEQLLTTVGNANRAAILSINTMECRYERRPFGNTSAEQASKYFYLLPGRFWRSGDAYRLSESITTDGTTREYLIRNGQGLWLRKGGPLPRGSLTFEPPRPVDGVGGEMWQYLLFSHWGWVPPPGASYYPFYEIVQHPHILRRVERLSSKEIHVELSHAGATRQEFWFDPKVNYLVRKCVWVPAGDTTLRWEHEVINFAEGSPSVFVPTIIENRCFVNGGMQAVVRTTVSSLKVNHAISKDALRLPGIAGMECVDLTRDVKFKVDADGNRVGPETRHKVVRISPGPNNSPPPRVSSSSGSISELQVSEPSTPWWLRILIVSVVVLAATGLVAVIRRRRTAA